jgi:hypothetical protein
MPLLIEGLQELADLAVTKEAPAGDSTWQAHSYIDGAFKTEDKEAIASGYLAHLKLTGISAERLFVLDRPLAVSPSGASNIRLTVAAPANATRQGYDYTLTMYTPRYTAPDCEVLFNDEDEKLYQQILAEGKLDSHQAELAVDRARQQRKPADTTAQPLPPIHPETIHSRFSLILSDKDVVRAIHTHTYAFDIEGPVELVTPVDVSHNYIEEAYGMAKPRLTALQRLVLDHRGAHALAHFDLSLALRHLAGDKLAPPLKLDSQEEQGHPSTASQLVHVRSLSKPLK